MNGLFHAGIELLESLKKREITVPVHVLDKMLFIGQIFFLLRILLVSTLRY